MKQYAVIYVSEDRKTEQVNVDMFGVEDLCIRYQVIKIGEVERMEVDIQNEFLAGQEEFYSTLDKEDKSWSKDESDQFTDHMKEFGFRGETI